MRAGWKRSGKAQTNVFGSLLIKTSLNLDLHQMSCSKWELRQRMWVRWRESEMHVQKRLKKSKHSINKLGQVCAKRNPEYDMHYVSLKWKSISWNIYTTGWHDQYMCQYLFFVFYYCHQLMSFKGIVHLKIKMLSLITHPHVTANL